MNYAVKAIAHEIKIRRVAYFYSAAERRSRGALWPSFAPALIGGFPCSAGAAGAVLLGLGTAIESADAPGDGSGEALGRIRSELNVMESWRGRVGRVFNNVE